MPTPTTTDDHLWEPLTHGWERVNMDPETDRPVYPGQPASVVGSRRGFFAWEMAPSGCCFNALAAWASLDGRRWHPVTGLDPSMEGRLLGDGMSDVVAWGDGYIAVGSVLPRFDQTKDGEEPDYTPEAAVWRSGDGEQWRRVPLPSTVSAAAAMERVIAVEGHLVAWGAWTVGERPAPTVVWRSSDGERWLRDEEAARTFASLAQVVTTPLGLVAFTRTGEGKVAPSTSADGLHWDAVLDTAVDVASGRIIASQSEIVIIDAARALAWRSSDGRNWEGPLPTRGLPSEEPRNATIDEIRDIAWTRAGFVAVGTEDDSSALWHSADGLTWEKVPDIEGAFTRGYFGAVIPLTNGMAILGGVESGWQGNKGPYFRPVAWLWTAPPDRSEGF